MSDDAALRERALLLRGLIAVGAVDRRDSVVGWNAAHPAHPKGGDGKWADVPGVGAGSNALDKLKLAGRIPLADGERLVGSNVFQPRRSGLVPMAVTRGPDGQRLRIGTGIADEDKKRWSGRDLGQTANLDEDGIRQLRSVLDEMRIKGDEGGKRFRAIEDRADELDQERRDIVKRQYRDLSKSQAKRLDEVDREIEYLDGQIAYGENRLRDNVGWLAENDPVRRARWGEIDAELAGLDPNDEADSRYIERLQREQARLVPSFPLKTIQELPRQRAEREDLLAEQRELTANPSPLSPEDQADLARVDAEIADTQAQLEEMTETVIYGGVIPGEWADLVYEVSTHETTYEYSNLGILYGIGARPKNADEDWDLSEDNGAVEFEPKELAKLAKMLDELSGDKSESRSLRHLPGGHNQRSEEFGVYEDNEDGPDTPLLRHLKGLHDQSSHAGLKGKAKKAVSAVKDAVDGDLPKSPRAPRKRVTSGARKPKAPMGGSSNDDAISDDPSVKHAQAILDTEYNLWSAQYGDDPDRWPDDASAEYHKLKELVAQAKKKAATGRSRTFGLCTRAFDFELDGPGDGRTLEGYAAVFNAPARIRDLQGDFDEVILPGAFTRSLARRTPVLQFDHGKDPRIGGTPIGKIERLAEDGSGLYVRARLFSHPDVDRVREAIAEKAVTGMSFRFGVPNGGDKWSNRSGDVDLREIREADTHELGPVVFPAYDSTSVSVRSILSGLDAAQMRELVHELSAYLRDAVDLSDLTGRPSARRAGGGDYGGRESPLSTSVRADRDALRLRGIIR